MVGGRCLPAATELGVKFKGWVGEMVGSSCILLAEPDTSIRSEIEDLLGSIGKYRIITTGDGIQARTLVGMVPFVLALLNVQLPGMSGVDLCRILHETSRIPVMLITSQANVDEINTGLDAGATDFVMLPIRPCELLARVRTALKRASAPLSLPAYIFCYDDLLLDLRSHKVVKNGVVLSVTRTELRLLACFMRNPGQTMNRETLLREVWGYENMGGDGNLIDSAIRRLRRSIEDDPKNPKYVHTVWGQGYRFGG